MASSRAEHGTKDSLGPVILWASPALAAQVDKLAGVQWLVACCKSCSEWRWSLNRGVVSELRIEVVSE